MTRKGLELLQKQQMDGCYFVITWGTYDDYSIDAVFGGWLSSLYYLRNANQGVEGGIFERRIEVWNGSEHVGNWIQVVTKREWDVLGVPKIEHGVRWDPID